MIQSRKFLPRDIANIYSRYVSHPLFVAIDEACYRWEEQMQCLMLSPAEIFWHTANHLDTIREQQEDAMPMIERLATPQQLSPQLSSSRKRGNNLSGNAHYHFVGKLSVFGRTLSLQAICR